MTTTLFVILSFILLFFIIYNSLKKKKPLPQPDKQTEKDLIGKYVSFYKDLNTIEKEEFIQRVQRFLSKVKITGVKTNVEDLDRVLIASAAIIPIFHFKNWEYSNIHEVLLYPHSFSGDYRLEGEDRNVLGEVGSGPLQNIMLLSKPDLRNGFERANTKSNTAIHEFVHLIDKTDGTTDGLPEVLLNHQYSIPWLRCIHSEMKRIQDSKSDINPYALTNEAEFFAVVSEYFFKQPHLMESRHPEIYNTLDKIFNESHK